MATIRMRYEVEDYLDKKGRRPYTEWLFGLKDGVARSKLLARVYRASWGNFGDWKPLTGTKGLFEMREHHGPGYRIYFTIVGQKIILLLSGSCKGEQARAIRKATEYLEDYRRRTQT